MITILLNDNYGSKYYINPADNIFKILHEKATESRREFIKSSKKTGDFIEFNINIIMKILDMLMFNHFYLLNFQNNKHRFFY